jgi:holo-[acyl-carrier protein] synthase
MNKIYGVGTDIVDITRIKKSIKNKKFINKIFSDREIKNSKNKLDSYYAKRFAAKEAFSKALGTGISEGISFNEISILNNDKGQPYIELLGKTKIIVKKKIKKRKIFLSLSDEKKYAIATVIIN